jgi:hypothetical protein
MCRADCGPAGQYIGSKPPPKKTHWPCRGRRPRINKPMHRCGLPICRPYGALKTLARRCLATDMSPLRVGAARMCRADCGPAGQYIGSKPAVKKTRWPRRGRRPRVTGLVRHACAQRIVAQRASLLVAGRRPRKTRWPRRGRRPRINKALHRCGLPICRPSGACAARMGRTDCGPAGQYIGSKPPPKKTHWPCRGRRPRINNVLHRCGLPICRPNGAFPARMCRADCGPAGQYIGSKPAPKKTRWPRRGRRPRINNVLHRCGLPICRPSGALTTLARRCFATNMSPRWGFSGRHVPSGLWPSGPIYW